VLQRANVDIERVMMGFLDNSKKKKKKKKNQEGWVCVLYNAQRCRESDSDDEINTIGCAGEKRVDWCVFQNTSVDIERVMIGLLTKTSTKKLKIQRVSVFLIFFCFLHFPTKPHHYGLKNTIFAPKNAQKTLKNTQKTLKKGSKKAFKGLNTLKNTQKRSKNTQKRSKKPQKRSILPLNLRRHADLRQKRERVADVFRRHAVEQLPRKGLFFHIKNI
jgi:hypothetical protein